MREETLKFNSNAAKYVFDKKIPLELCPTSNMQCGAYDSIEEHPFGKLYYAGFNVTINTDNRLMSNISMSQEVENLVNAFGLDESDINTITQNTISAGFVDSKRRVGLQEGL